jgi:hypothetical protein
LYVHIRHVQHKRPHKNPGDYGKTLRLLEAIRVFLVKAAALGDLSPGRRGKASIENSDICVGTDVALLWFSV